MQDGFLFFGMVAVVGAAALAGFAASRAATILRSLAGCGLAAAAVALIVFFLIRPGEPDYAPLLGIAAGMFFWVIAFSASLLTRRVRSAQAGR